MDLDSAAAGKGSPAQVLDFRTPNISSEKAAEDVEDLCKISIVFLLVRPTRSKKRQS
jgi:hypothetical protein